MITNYDFGLLTGDNVAIAEKAHKEGRLWFRCCDQYGRSCNGGSPYSPPEPPGPGQPGEWTPRIERIALCESGYHVTNRPWKWVGLLVQLVETAEFPEVSEDKAVCHSYRVLALVDPERAIGGGYRAAAGRPFLTRANLAGADLTWANLTRADLTRANLTRADLTRANLTRADLTGADLAWANLTGADLTGADLTWANLAGARHGATTTWPVGFVPPKETT